MMAELGQSIRTRCDELGLGDDTVAVLVEDGKDFVEDLIRLPLMLFIVPALFSGRLVMHAIDCLEFRSVEDIVAIQIMQLEE